MSLRWRAVFGIALCLVGASCGEVPDLSSAIAVDRPPRLDPDYASLVIPPNIAPLNFRIEEEGRDYVVRITSDAGPPLVLPCADGRCRIGLQEWREMLDRNQARRLYFDIYVKKEDGVWVQFQRVVNTVAREPIDSYLVYRQLFPNKMLTTIKGIFQRNLESFASEPLVTLRDGTFTCFSCHTFHQHDPGRFLFHIRGRHAGMVLVMGDEIRKIDTQQEPMFRPLAYASWHPDGVHIAATLNMFLSHFPATEGLFFFEAIEKRGDLVVYNVETNTISTTRQVFGGEFIETHPCWSPDGRSIYFVRGANEPLFSHQDLDRFRFDLMRIACDVATGTWGSPETVMAYAEVGKSCAFPRPSPDGRYVLHILADKGTYPIHQRSSDLYILDLETREYRRLEAVNSELAESYPRWSANGRWFSFLSNRRDGLSALPYFAYFDSSGQAHKAFVLPQEDPDYYETFIDTYNVPELVRSRVEVGSFALARAMQGPAEDAAFPDPPAVDAYTGATWTGMVSEAMRNLEGMEGDGR